MKILGLMSASAAMLCLATTVGVHTGSRARAESAENRIAQQQVAPGVPNLTGQWTGTATISGEPVGIEINIAQEENAATGSCSVSGLPASPFEVIFTRQQGHLNGTWSVDGKHPRPFFGSSNSRGKVELTLKAGAGKHPNCAINVSGLMSNDSKEIAGIFKTSDGCKNKGQTGTFQVISQS